MILARLLGWIKGHKTFHIFLLEVLAVFIGITASLVIDDWRQQQADYDTLDHLLEEIHYNAVVENAEIRSYFWVAKAAIDHTVRLIYADPASLTDAERFSLIASAATPNFVITGDAAGYSRLTSTPLSIPFNHTIARIDEIFSNRNGSLAMLRAATVEVNTLARQIASSVSLIREDPAGNAPMSFRSYPDSFFFEGMDQSLPELYRVSIVGESELRALEALQTDEVKDLLLRSIDARQTLMVRLASLVSWNDQIIQAVREYNPAVLLPVEWISITGDATKGGWGVDTFLEQSTDDPRVWSVETELLDGEFKFRADKNFSVDWGAPLSLETHSGLFYVFVGDPEDVFPKGAAHLRGTNIPAKAGRYRVTFNLQTFEYSFQPTTDVD